MQDASYVRAAFSRIASRYVLTNHVLSLGIDVLWRRRTAHLAASLRPSTILDLATGSADLAKAMRRACPGARILAADFSVPMMREAQSLGWSELIAADGLALPIRDGCFDLVTVAFGLRNMASWPRALAEMHRVIAPGGHLIVLDFSLPTLPLIRPGYRFYLRQMMPRIAGWLTGQRADYEYLCSSVERFPSGRAMEELIMSQGFGSVRTMPLSFGIASIYVAGKRGSEG